jgi:peptidoglycan hydrolase-like protein with peptidoglycan-binding domain
VRGEGTRVQRGQSLFSVDGVAEAYVMYGRTPLYRRLDASADDGGDIRQLERNLVELGYAPGTVDADWTSSTTAAVKAWEEDRGAEEDAVVALGEVVFLSGTSRVGAHEADVGGSVRPGAAVLSVASTRRAVTAALDAGRQGLVERGDGVEVELPDGTVARGRISRVGAVASKPAEEGQEPTIELEVELRGRHANARGLDEAPVVVRIARESKKGALAVPVTALLARGSDRYVVEVARGGSRILVPVELGLFADGYVEVSGRGIAEGTRVVVPA